MSFLNHLVISFFCKKVGEDQYGNKYFQGRNTNYLGKKKRYVIYHGVVEPSKVPPLWHAWLHYLSDEVPSTIDKYKWQQEPIPNCTGTKFSYSPSRGKVSADYSKWEPQ